MPDGLDSAAAAADKYRGLAAIESLNATQTSAYDGAKAAADRFAKAAAESFPTTHEPSSSGAWVLVIGVGLLCAFVARR
jgi:hypothetical protein